MLSQFPDLVEEYGGTKGALHMPVNKTLPKTVIRALLKARLAQPD